MNGFVSDLTERLFLKMGDKGDESFESGEENESFERGDPLNYRERDPLNGYDLGFALGFVPASDEEIGLSSSSLPAFGLPSDAALNGSSAFEAVAEAVSASPSSAFGAVAQTVGATEAAKQRAERPSRAVAEPRYKPTEAMGFRDRDILFFGGHWWVRKKTVWEQADPPDGADPIEAMRTYLVKLMTAWRKENVGQEAKEGDEWMVRDKERKKFQFKVVFHDGGLEPKNKEIRRVLNLPDLKSPDYEDKELNEIQKALALRNSVTEGKAKRKGKEVDKAEDLVVGFRSTLQSDELTDRIDIIWSGTAWMPMERKLAKALGLIYSLTDILLRSGSR